MGQHAFADSVSVDELHPRRRLLIVGDQTGGLTASVHAALEELELSDQVIVDSARTPFDALADFPASGWMSGGVNVLLHIDPIRQRPGPAVTAMRQQLDQDPERRGRLILFGDEGSEALCRRLLADGVDAFILLPIDVASLKAMLSPMLVETAGGAKPAAATPSHSVLSDGKTALHLRDHGHPTSGALLPADLLAAGDAIEAMITHPAAAVARVVQVLDERLGQLKRGVSLSLKPLEELHGGQLSTPIRPDLRQSRHLVLQLPEDADGAERDMALHELGLIASDLGKLAEVEARHVQLQKLALSDELTGCANKRYFRHFLDKILERAKTERFPVTLLLFDIDDFKQYNDAHGHRVGDAILRQTAALIRRCVRDHDLVARIGGDEFAVVFWEKDDPRVPRDPTTARGRFPDAPLLISQRFRSLLSDPDHSEFAALGARGSGTLTISGGMSVFPYDGQSAADLIEAADRALLFHAKRDGKNSIALVGDDSTE